MNGHAIRFLLWEQFTRTYKIALMALAGIVASGFSTHLYLNRSVTVRPEDLEVIAGLTMTGITLSLIAYILGCLFAFGDDRDLQLDMPLYLLRLPVNTFTLVSCRLGYDVLSMALLAALGIAVHHVAMGIEINRIDPFWETVATFSTVMAFVRMMAWSIGKTGPVITIIGGVIVYNILDRVFERFGWWPEAIDGYSVVFTCCAIGATLVVSILVVRWHRRGSLAFLEYAGESAIGQYRRIDTELPPFASKEQAMRWYETRRQTRIYPVLAIALFLVIFFFGALKDIAALIEPFDYPLEVAMVVVGEVLFVTAAACLLIATFLASGIFFFQNQRTFMGGAKTFLFIRPAATTTLANARHMALFRSLAMACLPFLLIAAAVLYVDSKSIESSTFRAFIDSYSGIEQFVFTALIIIGCMACLWSVLWLGNLLAFLMVYGLCVMPLEYLPFFADIHELTRTRYALQATAIVMFLLVVPLAIVVHRRGLLERRVVLSMVSGLPWLAAGIFIIANYQNLGLGKPLDFSALKAIVPATVLVPLVPLLATPLFLNWARHR
jgi:hypothetical protein